MVHTVIILIIERVVFWTLRDVEMGARAEGIE